MAIDQVSIFMENHPGRLVEILELLAARGFDLRAYTVAETPDFGILRMILTDAGAAVTALKQQGYTAQKNAVLAVFIPDKPGSSILPLKLLGEAGINIEYTYAFAQPEANCAVLLLRVDDNAKAERILTDAGVRLVKDGETFLCLTAKNF